MKKHFRYFTYALLILFIFTLAACDTRGRPNDNTPDSPYRDQLKLSSWNELSGVNQSGLWLVYFYSPLCGACLTIQDDILGFANQYRDNYPVYFADGTSGFAGNPPATGINFFPTLIIMNDSQYIEHFTGVSSILNTLTSLANGSYQLPLG
jgi:hypothetical protein